ncbi:stage III sporulation protein AE [Eubacterium sp.]
MKKTAIFLCALLLFLLIPVSSYSMDYSEEEYNETLSSYDLSSFEKELDADTYKMLDELGVLDFSYESITGLSFNDIVGLLKSLFQKKAELPIKSSVTVLIFILLSAFLQSLKAESDDSVNMIYSTATALLVATVVLVKLTSTVSLASMAISVASNFVYAFIPVFCSIVVASGGITTGFSTNTTLLILAQGLSFISSNVFMPIVNCYLALGVTSSLRYELNLDKLLSSVKKIITTCISFVSGVFVSVLSVKTAVAGRADMLGLRSIRFAINSVVPVIGSSISEGLLSIQAYSSLIKSSVGIVGVMAVVLVFLPSIIEVVLWRISLTLCVIVSDVFGDKSVSAVLNAFLNTLLLINVILILSMVTTVISFGILIAAGGVG